MPQFSKKRRRSAPPGMLRHASGQARVVLDGDTVYFGKFGTPEAHARYAEFVFQRFKALLTEPSVYTFAARHDDIEAIYKKLQEQRDSADVVDVLQALHRSIEGQRRYFGRGPRPADAS